jgi:hypothetical protein
MIVIEALTVFYALPEKKENVGKRRKKVNKRNPLLVHLHNINNKKENVRQF